MFIRDICHPNPHTIDEDASIKDAIAHMLHHEFNGYIVLDKRGKVKGILSLQDVAAATVPNEFRENIQMAAAMYRQGYFDEMCVEIADKKVKDVMRKEYVSVGYHTNIMAITADFLRNDLYIVPVIEKGELVGVVTRSEIKKAIGKAMGLP